MQAADEHFRRHGYRQASMANIAADVGTGASALYRHFDTKQDLLDAVMTRALDSVRHALDGPTGLDEQLAALIGVVARSRGPWTLWEREAVNLADDARRDAADRIRDIHERLVDTLGQDHPAMARDEAALRAWAALAVVRVGTHPRGVPVADAARLLVAAARAIASTPLPATTAPPPRRPTRPLAVPSSRHEAILGAASRAFGERGYGSVTLEEIGRAAGISGPSIYNHFDSKSDLLQRVVHRVNEVLWMGVHRALNTTDTAEAALRALLDQYVDFALASPELIGTVVAELVHLPADRRDEFRRIQQAYIDEWVDLQRLARPDLDPPQALVLVLGTLSVVNTLARTPDLRDRPHLHDEIAPLGTAVLDVAVPVATS